MKTAERKSVASAVITELGDSAVGLIFDAYPSAVKESLLDLRTLILDTAKNTAGVGALEETLKWGQPSYLTTATKSGSTIRIDRDKSAPDAYALFVHCQTDLVATFRELYPDEMTYVGNRSIVFRAGDSLPEQPLRHCIGLALTYHLRKRKAPQR